MYIMTIRERWLILAKHKHSELSKCAEQLYEIGLSKI